MFHLVISLTWEPYISYVMFFKEKEVGYVG